MPSLLAEDTMEESTSQESFTSMKYRLPAASVDDGCSKIESAESASSKRVSTLAKKSVEMPPSANTDSSGKPISISTFDIKQAVTAYVGCCINGTASLEMLKESVAAWIQHTGPKEDQRCASASSAMADKVTASNFSASSTSQDFASCVSCQCFLADPVTIPCGHTYCKKCVTKVPHKTCLKCKKCLSHLNWSTFKVNVVIANLLEKWWPSEAHSVKLRNEGNQLFEEKLIENAEERYSEASKLANTDHLLASNRSCALLNLGKAREALHWAERSIQLRPDWPKGYYRKGAALLSLGLYEDAVVAYLQCLVLDNNLPPVVIELSKILHRVISMLTSSKLLHILGKTEETDDILCQMSGPFLNRSKRRRGMLISDLMRSSQNKFSDSSDDQSDDEAQTCNKRRMHCFGTTHNASFEDYGNSKECLRLYQFLDWCQLEMERIKKVEPRKMERLVNNESSVDKTDLECTLCYRLFWQPVTTPCGHVFCRVCLDRCLDHNPRCPLCKAGLDEYLAERRQFVTEFINVAMRLYIPEDYAAREKSHHDEMHELASSVASNKLELPIFVCTLGFPTVPCPLHVFEPRYRLMIRRCMESGSRKFGMCPTVEGSSETFSDFGTVLEIRDVQYFPDGRALVDTVGCERFHVLQRDMKDGYHTAVVEILHDQRPNNGDLIPEVGRLHDSVYSEVTQWFGNLSLPVRNRILHHFGPMPDREADYHRLDSGPAWVWWTLAILPLDPRAQLAILAMTSLQKRLEALHRTLDYIFKQTS